MQQRQTEDWIDHIIEMTNKNYNGREIVIWGRYGVSIRIKNILKEKYGIDIAFYVDSDIAKIDEKQVFSPDCLSGKSDQYYVVVPIAVYQSVREKLSWGGYFPGVDYYYFCDCALHQTPEYYEDAHGNKIIGKYEGLKFVFSGFHSVIEIEDNVQFKNTSIYVHSDSKIFIGSNTQLFETQLCTCHSSKTEMKCGCNIARLNMMVGELAEVILGEEVEIGCNTEDKTNWHIGKNAELKVGNQGRLSGRAGKCVVEENALLKIGKEFSLNGNYRMIAYSDTSILIGDDCMFSYDIKISSNDGHSIFDITTKENINSSYHISRDRKVIIGNHVWVGECAEILYNTQIGNGSIIGAMSLVKSKIPNNCIAAGIPARVIRKNVAWCRQCGAADILECGQEYIHYTEE